MIFRATLCTRAPGACLGRGILRGRKGQRGCRERVGGGGRAVCGWAGCASAQRGSTVLVVRAMSRSVICDDHDMAWSFKFVVYLQYRFRTECTHPRDYRMYHGFFPNKPVMRTLLMMMMWTRKDDEYKVYRTKKGSLSGMDKNTI